MRNPIRKLNSSRGESLIETLTSILIICLASILFAVMTMASSRLNATARTTDATFYSEVSQAETHSAESSPGSVAVSWAGGSQFFAVSYSGGSGELRSYTGAGGGGG